MNCGCDDCGCDLNGSELDGKHATEFAVTDPVTQAGTLEELIAELEEAEEDDDE